MLYDLLMPTITLVSLAIAYLILQRQLGGVLDVTLSSLYGRGFLVGICGCAVWLSMAVFSHAEPLRKLLHEYRHATMGTADQAGPPRARSKEK